MRYLVDSDWIVDCLHGEESAIQTLSQLGPEGLAVSIISIAEIYEGAFAFPDPDRHLSTFRTFLRAFTVLTIDDEIAERFARIRAQLRREGRAPADFDLLIAATSLRHGLTLLTRNVRDFRRVPDLQLFEV